MISAQKIGVFGLIASSALASSALGVVPWSNPNGNTILFAYSGGEANNGYFGDPTISPNTFNFAPPAFFAGSPNAATLTDTLTVTLTVNPGETITGIRVTEVGTRTLGTTSVTGTLFVKDLQNGGFGQVQQSLTITNGAPNGSIKPWQGSALITGFNFTEGQMLSISLTNNLLALTGQRIDKTGVVIEILPTPGVLGVAGVASLVLARRRRDD